MVIFWDSCQKQMLCRFSKECIWQNDLKIHYTSTYWKNNLPPVEIWSSNLDSFPHFPRFQVLIPIASELMHPEKSFHFLVAEEVPLSDLCFVQNARIHNPWPPVRNGSHQHPSSSSNARPPNRSIASMIRHPQRNEPTYAPSETAHQNLRFQ